MTKIRAADSEVLPSATLRAGWEIAPSAAATGHLSGRMRKAGSVVLARSHPVTVSGLQPQTPDATASDLQPQTRAATASGVPARSHPVTVSGLQPQMPGATVSAPQLRIQAGTASALRCRIHPVTGIG
jgi:hypothetical protein